MNHFILIFVLLFSFCTQILSQSNLVLNPSFETHYDSSVLGISAFVPGWVTNWSDPNRGSSDYFLPNSYGGETTPPGNVFGFEYPKSGLCYAGFVFLDEAISNFHEYIQASFLNPLTSGKTYAIQCYVSGADVMPSCASDLGFYFSNSLVSSTPIGDRINVIPQFANPDTNIISTRIGWQRITGTYTAVGGEQFLSIGNFKPYPACHVETCGEDTLLAQGAYLFIDDVAVYDTSKVDTIQLCMNDSVKIGDLWQHDEGLYSDLIGGLSVRFYVKIRPFSSSVTIVEKPFFTGDSVRITLMQTGVGNDSTANSHNFVYVSTNRTIDVPMYNIYGCDSTVRYICGTNIGIRHISDYIDWHIYPNPANDFIEVKILNEDRSRYEISIVDFSGRLITLPPSNTDRIDISKLQSGLYFVRLTDIKSLKVMATEKFVKE